MKAVRIFTFTAFAGASALGFAVVFGAPHPYHVALGVAGLVAFCVYFVVSVETAKP